MLSRMTAISMITDVIVIIGAVARIVSTYHEAPEQPVISRPESQLPAHWQLRRLPPIEPETPARFWGLKGPK